MARLDFRRGRKIVLPAQRPSVPFFFNLCIQTRAMGWEDMGHVFNTRCLCCCKIRWERGKQYANPVECEQITDVKTDMVVVGLVEKKQKTTGAG